MTQTTGGLPGLALTLFLLVIRQNMTQSRALGVFGTSPILQNSPDCFYLPCGQPYTEQPSQGK